MPDEPHHPPIAPLIRQACRVLPDEVSAALTEAGLDDLRDIDRSVVSQIPPEGAKPIDLAQAAGASRQAINVTLRGLEANGYVERRPPPGKTTRRVWLTPRGEHAAHVIHSAIMQLEARWVARLGATRMQDFRSMLEEISAEGERA